MTIADRRPLLAITSRPAQGLPVVVAWFLVAAGALAGESADRYFTIHVVDAQTGRGVPLVELRTVYNARYYTDSNGIVAFREPGLMGQKVFFYVQSHGYEFPKDGFGFAGTSLEVKEGGKAQIKM